MTSEPALKVDTREELVYLLGQACEIEHGLMCEYLYVQFSLKPAILLLPHQDAAWKIIKERLDALQQACASLGGQPGLGALAPLADKLESMSQDIGSHGSPS